MSYVLTITSFDVNGVKRVSKNRIETPIGNVDDLMKTFGELDESLFFAMGSLDPFQWGYSDDPINGRSDPQWFHGTLNESELRAHQARRFLDPKWVDRRGDNLLVP